MQFEFTHRLDTRRIGNRFKSLKIYWYLLLEFFVQKGDKSSIRYYLEDLKSKKSLSTDFGISNWNSISSPNRI